MICNGHFLDLWENAHGHSYKCGMCYVFPQQITHFMVRSVSLLPPLIKAYYYIPDESVSAETVMRRGSRVIPSFAALLCIHEM